VGVYFARITQALALCFATLLVSQQESTGGFNGLTDFSTLLKRYAGAWVGRSSGNTTARGSSGTNLGSFATLTQATNSIVAPAAEPIRSKAKRRLAPLSLLLGSNFFSAPVL